MKDNEFMSIQVPLSQHDRRLLEDGLGRTGNAVFAFAALFFVQIFYGASLKSNIPLPVIELAFFGVGLVLIFLCAAARPGESVWGRFGVRGFVFFMLAIIVSREIFDLAKSHFGWETPITAIQMDAVAAQLFGVAIVTPIIEEVIYRQYLFRAFSCGSGRLASLVPILGTSTIFALSHLAYWGTASLLFVSLAGLLMGWARARSGGILLPLAMHIGMNTHAILRAITWH